MEAPLKAGDKAVVIDGVLKAKSPNLGKQVTVIAVVGEHSKLGRIYRCQGENLVDFAGSIHHTADFPRPWLKLLKEGEDKLERETLLDVNLQ